MIMDNNEKAFESYTGTEVFQILLDGSSSRAVLDDWLERNIQSDLKVRRALQNSCMLSSDVSAAYDPNYASVFEKKNAAYFGKGMVFNKYTGARGKSGSNDASAEFVGKLRKVMDDADVSFQTAELGKVDIGGGGTIAYILANLDMNVIDSGIAVQNMHAPYEVISKADLYETLKGYEAFLKNA